MQKLDECKIHPFGDHALIVTFESVISETVNAKVVALSEAIEHSLKHEPIVDVVPAYQSLTVIFDPLQTSFQQQYELIADLLKGGISSSTSDGKTINIPVCYHEDFGLDLKVVADKCRLSISELIDIHLASKYRVYMTGFSPGFVYMGKLDEKIHIDRKASPRLQVPMGSVAIANEQCGIYPFESPGGWHIVGRSPVDLIGDPHNFQPIAEVGNYIQFISISKNEFESSKDQ